MNLSGFFSDKIRDDFVELLINDFKTTYKDFKYYNDDSVFFISSKINPEEGLWNVHNYIIIFLGSIYNLKGKEFTLSNMNDDLIPSLYMKYGLNITDHIEGNFIILIYNKEKKCLNIIRDHLGQNILYYNLRGGELFFSTKLKTLLKLPLKAEIDYNSLTDYLEYGCVYYPKTLIKDFFKLAPASTLTFNEKKLNINKYFKFNYLPNINNESIACEMIYNHLSSIVKCGVDKYEKPNLLLSGGFDSSLLAALIRKQTKKGITAYTFKYENEVSDSAYTISEKLNLDYKELSISSSKIREIIEKLPYYYDDILSDPFMSIPTYVLLNDLGVGSNIFAADNADNVFMGLPQVYERFNYVKKMKLIPRPVRSSFLKILSHVDMRYVIQRSLFNLVQASLSVYPYDKIDKIFTRIDSRKILKLNSEPKDTPKPYRIDLPDNLSLIQFYRYQIETLSDRTANIARLRGICVDHCINLFEPFLSPSLIQLGLSIVPSLKQPSARRDKEILRRMATKYDILPKEFKPVKKGLKFPIDDWVRNDGFAWVHENLIEKNNFLDRKMVESLLTRSKKIDNFYNITSRNRTSSRDIFTLLMLNLWVGEYFVGRDK